MKRIYSLSAALALALFSAGCGSDSDSDSSAKTKGMTGVYHGYAEDTSGAPLYLRSFVVNDNTIILSQQDAKDDTTVIAGTVDGDNITFGDFTCKVANAEMVCNGYTLETLSLGSFDVATAAGTYTAIDSDNQQWTMNVNVEGSITASSEAIPTCSVTGTMTSELDSTVPTIVFTLSGCGNDGKEYAVAMNEDIDANTFAINILNSTDTSSSFWFNK
jgi:hypothetical protein